MGARDNPSRSLLPGHHVAGLDGPYRLVPDHLGKEPSTVSKSAACITTARLLLCVSGVWSLDISFRQHYNQFPNRYRNLAWTSPRSLLYAPHELYWPEIAIAHHAFSRLSRQVTRDAGGRDSYEQINLAAS
jgi:hypothetical protein